MSASVNIAHHTLWRIIKWVLKTWFSVCRYKRISLWCVVFFLLLLHSGFGNISIMCVCVCGCIRMSWHATAAECRYVVNLLSRVYMYMAWKCCWSAIEKKNETHIGAIENLQFGWVSFCCGFAACFSTSASWLQFIGCCCSHTSNWHWFYEYLSIKFVLQFTIQMFTHAISQWKIGWIWNTSVYLFDYYLLKCVWARG